MAGRKSARPEEPIEQVESVAVDIANAEEAVEHASDPKFTAVECDPIDHNYVTIPKAQAEKILDLFQKLKDADTHFKTCQSTNFREYVRSVLNAPKISGAFESLKEQIQ